jgi:hypothetical protein
MAFAPLTLLYEQILIEGYNKDFYIKQIARLKPQAGPYVTEEQIKSKIKRFGDLKQTKGFELTKKIKDAIDQGKLPPDQRQAAAIEPNVKGISAEEIEYMKGKELKQLTPKQKTNYKKYQAELQRVQMIEKVPLEIRNFKWNDLEVIVDQFPDPEEKRALNRDREQGSGGQLIYNQNNLKVYFGADGNQCFLIKSALIRYRDSINDPTNYNWCIANSPVGPGNLHQSYRFGSYGGIPKSSYIVHDLDKTSNDKWHAMVIQVGERIPDGQPGKYYITSAKNDGDLWVNWDQILNIQPKLQGLEHLFIFYPFTEDEQILQQMSGQANANSFKKYTSFKVKRAYIRTGKSINKEDYAKLDSILQYTYINLRSPNAEDVNSGTTLRRLMTLFANSDIKTEWSDKLELAKNIGRRPSAREEDLLNALTDNPIMVASKDTQTYTRWRNFIRDVTKGIGVAKKAADQKAAAQRGL